jgi:hypothetical protein
MTETIVGVRTLAVPWPGLTKRRWLRAAWFLGGFYHSPPFDDRRAALACAHLRVVSHFSPLEVLSGLAVNFHLVIFPIISREAKP